MENDETIERAAVVFNGKYTLISPSGEHRTFRIKTMPSRAKQLERRPDKQPFAPDKRVIALLVGSDNQTDYKGFGFVDDDGIHVWGSKRNTADRYEKLSLALWNILTTENGWFAQRGFTVEKSCTCLRCNKELTNPISIRTGLGPECAGRGSKRKKNRFKLPEISRVELSQTL